MKGIYVLGEDKQLHEIDAGVSEYAELVDAPFKTTYNDILLVGSTVAEEEGVMVLTKAEEHLWSEDEVDIFCKYAESGRYDICTNNYGTEILIVDKTNSNLGERYRRITPDQDMIYDKDSGWISITDTSAKELVFKLQNEDDFINATSVVGNKVVMECYFFSTLGSGNIVVTKEGKTVASSVLPVGKTTTINLTNYIGDGENQFYYTVTNSKNKEVNGSLSVTGIEITYKPTFNVLSLQRETEGNVNFSFTYNGTGNKYVHFDIINADGQIYSFNSPEVYKNGGSATYSIPAVEYDEQGEISRRIFSQGANIISTYMFMKVGNTEDILTKTDALTYTFPFIEEGRESEYVVMTYYDFAAIQEWATIAIPYRVWCGVSAPVDSIKFELEYEQEGKIKVRQQEYSQDDKGAEESYLSVNTEHFWQLSGIPHGTLEFRIYVGKKDEEGNYVYGEPNYVMSDVEVPESDYNFNTVGGYLFNFAANDIEDTKAFDSWMSETASMQLNGFNWITDGITTETEGKCLKFSPLAKASISDLKLFSYALPIDRNTVATSGLTLEFDFKVNENANNGDPIIRFFNSKNADSKYGIIIYPTKAVFNYNPYGTDEQITIDFQKGERKNVAIVIEPSGALNSTFLIRIYLDGIISKCIKYANSTTSSDCDRIEFNTSSNEFFLYSCRAYASVLSSQNMLQNYISNFADIDTKTELLLNNKIYDETRDVLTYVPSGTSTPLDLAGEYPVSLKACIGKIPCLVIYTPDGALPETKAKVNCYTLFYEKDDNNPQTEWKNGRSMATTYYYNDDGELAVKPITVGGQGTSSLEYPRKNFKFKYKNKFYIKGHTNGRDKTITVKVD